MVDSIVNVGKLIKKSREELGLTLTELADQIGYSNPYLSTIETGKRKNVPSPELLKKLAEHLPNVSYAGLLEEAGYKELSAYERMKQAAEDFGEENSYSKQEVSSIFIDNVQDLYQLLKNEMFELSELNVKPKYKGRELSPAEREQVLKMLEVLFPEA